LMPPRMSRVAKRRAMIDTDGRALVLQTHPASVQDRDGAVPLLQASRGSFPFVEHVFADNAYAVKRVANATNIVVEIVRKLLGQVGFRRAPAPPRCRKILRLD